MPVQRGQDYTRLGNDTLYVHLNTGNVVEVKPATGLRMTNVALEVLHEAEVVATFKRSTVFSATGAQDESPPRE